MDPHLAPEFYRMKLFLAGLNHVLGAVIPLKDKPNFNHANFQNRSSDCRPTQGSRAWKRSRLPRLKPQIQGFKSQHTAIKTLLHTSRNCVVRLPLRTQAIDSTHKEHRPQGDTQNFSRLEFHDPQAPHYSYASEPKQQYLERPCTNEPDQHYLERPYTCEHEQQYFEEQENPERYTEGFNDEGVIYGDSAANEDFVPDYHNDPDKNRNNATASDAINPEFSSDPVSESFNDNLQEASPEIVQPDQQEPEFDMANYSATDINRWASTLSVKQFVYLDLMGSAAQNESFKQYAISHINRPTQSLTQDNCSHSPQQFEQRLVTFNDQNEYINYEPDNTNDPNCHPFETGDEGQAPCHAPDSSFYNGSNGSNGLDHNDKADFDDLHNNNPVFDGNGGGGLDNYDDGGGYNDCDDGGGYGGGNDGGGYKHFDDGGGYEHSDDGGGFKDFDDGAEYNDFDDGAKYNDFDDGAGYKNFDDGQHDPDYD
ncbi:hypothetical protein PSTG_02464 [Puccinia striiformis f. sp. tritici PST-78]|uniref:Uncharacterized protein n=1 Tax=Puccinia striiformis f. sp. tritici PST-78 TaxID=1165861 RepID=A0A0L0VZX4_9BASI|nr:hypothetical protein PSTG_02464 [Puccinia striiformis f. sp. tritici PST-78]